MSGRDPFARILGALHAAAFDDAAWPAASGLIDAWCGSKGNMLTAGDGQERRLADIMFARLCYRGQHSAERERAYYETWYAIDERVPRLRRLPDSRIVHVDELYTGEERKHSVVYNEVAAASDTGNCLHARLDGPDGSHIVWTVADPVDADGWTSARVRTVARLLPHLRQFMRVRQALAGAGALGASLVRLLDDVRVGVIRLDRRGGVAAANDRALELLKEPGGLRDAHGRLHASLPREDRKLQGLLAQALPGDGGAGASGSMPVTRASPRAPLAVHLHPLSAVAAGAAPGLQRAPGALVLAIDPADRPGLDPERVAAALDLTPAEGRVATALAEGRTIADIAAATGRSPTTVKWHLRHIYEKHGLTRQVELARLVSSLADAWGFRG